MSLLCPYCEALLDDPDNEGFLEGETYEEQCKECGKHFALTVSYSVNYYGEKCECMNGAPHEWEEISGYPEEYFANRRRCKMCDQSKTLEQIAKLEVRKPENN